MTTASNTNNNSWQLSLWMILAIVLAIATWLTLATQSPGISILFAFATALISGISFFLYGIEKRYAAMLLCSVYLGFLALSSLYFVQNYMRNLSIHLAKQRTLHTLCQSMNQYYADWKEYPPADSKSAFVILEMDFSRRAAGTDINTTTIRMGDTGNALKWELHGKDTFILIDVGEDGVAGKYVRTEDGFKRVPSDANRDGIDDATDDRYESRTQGTERR